ncbi:TPA: fructose-bisphosphatase class III, partial [Clostridioides difficile]|nr:fructose-bisphosphatase class III [Clostridioides difficile]
ESPIKANGKILVIDGGFSRAYQKTTGIAGYTLIYNSRTLQLVSHEPFNSAEEAIANESDILSTTVVVEHKAKRKMVRDTDEGVKIQEEIEDLKLLLMAYKKGLIKEM